MLRSHTSLLGQAVLAPQLTLVVFAAIFLIVCPDAVAASCRQMAFAAKDVSFCKDRVGSGYGLWEFTTISRQDGDAKTMYERAALTGKSADCLAYAKDAICAGAFIPCEKTDFVPDLLCDSMCTAIDTWCGDGTYKALGYSPVKSPFKRGGTNCPLKDWKPPAATPTPSAAASATATPAASSNASATPTPAPASAGSNSDSDSDPDSDSGSGSSNSTASAIAAPLAVASALTLITLV